MWVEMDISIPPNQHRTWQFQIQHGIRMTASRNLSNIVSLPQLELQEEVMRLKEEMERMKHAVFLKLISDRVPN